MTSTTGTTDQRSRPRIVVGVDGSANSIEALRWSYEEAARRGAVIEVVHAWHHPYVAELGGVGAYALASTDLEQAAKEVMAQVLTDAGPVPDGVKIEPLLALGSPAEELLKRTADADLLVVGARGHGGFTGLLLGSVSQQCSHHAHCPVVIVPRAA